MKKDKAVVEEVVSYMREQISNGSWPLHSKIPSENKLCEELGVGRGSIRAALQRFRVLGIMESQQGKGTFVRSLDISLFGKGYTLDSRIMNDMFTIRHARSILEPEIAFQVAAHATPDLIDCLNTLNEQLKAAVGKQEQFVRLDAQFHMTLTETIQNPIISNIMNQLLDQTVCLNNNRVFGYFGGIHYHTKIAHAIAQHNPEQARSMMKEHIVSELFKPTEEKA